MKNDSLIELVDKFNFKSIYGDFNIHIFKTNSTIYIFSILNNLYNSIDYFIIDILFQNRHKTSCNNLRCYNF